MRESRRFAREQIPNRKHYRVPAKPPITLGEMQEGETKWVWAYCEAFSGRWSCSHHAPIALAPYVIRWGYGLVSWISMPSPLRFPLAFAPVALSSRRRVTSIGGLPKSLDSDSRGTH